MKDPIERQDALDALEKYLFVILRWVEIVRCKDCEYYAKDHDWDCIDYAFCSISPFHRERRKPNDFCSRAERRTEP